MLKALTYTVTSHYGNSGYMYNNSYNTMSAGQAKAVGGIILGFTLIIFALFFVGAFGFYKLAKKLNHPNPWWAFIPVLNVIQLFQMAELSLWYLLLFFIAGGFVIVIPVYQLSQRLKVNIVISLFIYFFIPFYWPFYVLKNMENIQNTSAQQSVQSFQPGQSTQPVQSTQPIQSTQPSQPSQPVQTM